MEETIKVTSILSTYSGTISVLLGSALTGFITYKIAKFNKDKDTKAKDIEFKKKKIEEMYMNFTIWSDYIIKVSIYFLQFHDNRIDKKTLNKRIKKIGSTERLEVPINYNNLKMIIDLYFPEFEKNHSEILKEFELINAFSNSSKENNYSGHKVFLSEFDEKCEKFKKEIANLIPAP